MEHTDNIHIKAFKYLFSPWVLRNAQPAPRRIVQHVAQSRQAIQSALAGGSGQLLAIVGPCSLHDPLAAIAYAEKLKTLQNDIGDRVLIIMRAYVEKPRTTLGWKGMIYDPHLDNSYDIKAGLRQARTLFLRIAQLGLPIATEFLDPIVPQYLADLVSWAAIGARTTESQIHRQMASGLSMPIGFKNGTDGNLACAVDAIQAAASAHAFLGINRNGKVIVAETKGNPYGHLVMRGGFREPNYGAEHIAYADILLKKNDIKTKLVVDCSHANSSRNYKQQGCTCMDVLEQIKAGNRRIAGVMLESFLVEGKQPCDSPENLIYGQSITDACMGWEETESLLRYIREAIAC